MTDEQTPDAQSGAVALGQMADQVSGSADKVVEQLASLRQELHDATEKANKDIAAAKAKAAKDVAAERRDRHRATAKFAIVVLLDVALSLVSIGLWRSLEETNNRLQTSLRENYVTAAQQAETRVQVLCPLYTLLLTAAASPNPAVAPTVAEEARIAKALSTIQAGYKKLGCTPKLPSASSG